MRARNEFILADMIANRAESDARFRRGHLRRRRRALARGADVRRPVAQRQPHRCGADRSRHAQGRPLRSDHAQPSASSSRRMVAASVSGCVFVPIDPRTRGEKLAFTLRHSGCRGVVCADYTLAEIAAIRARCRRSTGSSCSTAARMPAACRRADIAGAESSRCGRRRAGDVTPMCAYDRSARRVRDHLHLGHHRRPERRRVLEHALRRRRCSSGTCSDSSATSVRTTASRSRTATRR